MNQLTLVLFVHLIINSFSNPFDIPNDEPKPLIVQKENGGLYLMVPKQDSPIVTPTNRRISKEEKNILNINRQIKPDGAVKYFVETTTLNVDTFNSNNRMLGDNYPPKTIEVQDQAVDVKTTNDMKETQYSAQEETITTNLISSDEKTTESVDIPTTTNVEIITTEGVEISTSVQSELTTSMNHNEDTTKEKNDNTVTDQTTAMQDDSTDLRTDLLEFNTEESDNLLLDTLLKVKEKPANYSRLSNTKYYDSDENEDDDEATRTVDIKKRKYNIKESKIKDKDKEDEGEEDDKDDWDNEDDKNDEDIENVMDDDYDEEEEDEDDYDEEDEED